MKRLVTVVTVVLLAGPARAETVLVRNATVHTMAAAGTLEGADILLRDGTIEGIGRSLDAHEPHRARRPSGELAAGDLEAGDAGPSLPATGCRERLRRRLRSGAVEPPLGAGMGQGGPRRAAFDGLLVEEIDEAGRRRPARSATGAGCDDQA